MTTAALHRRRLRGRPRPRADSRLDLHWDEILRRLFGRAGVAALALFAAMPTPPVRAATTGAGRIALVVGVAEYSAFPLKNPVPDADLVATELTKLGFRVTELRNPRRSEVIAAVTVFTREAAVADAAILYFSGHGMEREGVNYLLPRDARFDAEALISSTVSASKLREGVVPASAVRLIILDACRNNPLGGAGGGLARESIGSSSEVVTLMAAAPGQVASDGSTHANGPFALALVAALQRPGMTVGELPRYVQSEVQHLTGQVQTPDLQGIWRNVNWSFSTVPTTQGGAQSADDRQKAEVAFWEGVRDSSDPEDFRTYLAEVDDGRFTGLFRTLAFKRLDKLGAPVPAVAATSAAAPAAQSRTEDPTSSMMASARAALVRGDHATAVKDWRVAAAKGDGAAMSNLGLASVMGLGTPADLPAAADWFRRSAERGDAAGMTNYAALLLNGGGVRKDEAAGLWWLRKAAEAGSPSAMEALGEVYARGERAPRDAKQAVLWMTRAVDAGDGPALTDLAYWYEGGLNVARDPQKAMQLYNRAALAGRGAAMVRLGLIYETGDLAPLDFVQAASWFQRGAEVGAPEAMRRLAALYETGRGVPADPAAAVAYYRRAASAGDGPAQEALTRLGVSR